MLWLVKDEPQPATSHCDVSPRGKHKPVSTHRGTWCEHCGQELQS